MKSTYTEAFVEQALVKLLSRGDRTIRSVAEDLNVESPYIKELDEKSISRKAKCTEWERETATGLAAGRTIGCAA